MFQAPFHTLEMDNVGRCYAFNVCSGVSTLLAVVSLYSLILQLFHQSKIHNFYVFAYTL